MGQIKDLTGKKFGKLTAIKFAYIKNSQTFWEWQCDCGNIKIASSANVKAGNTRSCDCLIQETAILCLGQNLVGQRFGRLVAVERIPNYKRKLTFYKCICDCGNEKIIRNTCLTDGTSKSCGCLQKELHIKLMRTQKNFNEFIDCGDTVKVLLSNNLDYAIIDSEDLEKIKPYYWFKNKKGYARNSAKTGIEDKTILMHRYIMNVDKNDILDHKNRNRLDNRKSNLRIVTYSENALNCRISSKNKSGYKGISIDKNNKYSVSITLNKKVNYIGTYKNIDDAVSARNKFLQDNNIIYY